MAEHHGGEFRFPLLTSKRTSRRSKRVGTSVIQEGAEGLPQSNGGKLAEHPDMTNLRQLGIRQGSADNLV